jgi:hypothetical protein
MKSATSYYKQSYSKNLTQILKTLLTTQKINEPAKDTYSLHATVEKELRAKLAG